MGGSRRSAIHCFWRRNRLPLLLEVFGVHLSKGDRRSMTISGRTYRGPPHVAWDTRSEAVSTRRLSNQACHELDEISTVVQPFRNRLDDNLSSNKSAQPEKSDSPRRNKGRT